MIATLSALVLGLLVASAKNTFDTAEAEMTQGSAKIILLDRLLADYGPETKAAREQLRRHCCHADRRPLAGGKNRGGGIGRLRADEWVGGRANDAAQSHADNRRSAPVVRCGAADLRRSASDPLALGRTNAEPDSNTLPCGVALLADGACTSVSACLAPRNATVITVLLICALSVSGAIFMILEMSSPAGRHNQSFQCTNAQGPGTSGAVGKRPQHF